MQLSIMTRLVLVVCLVALAASCSRPLKTARLDHAEPLHAEEAAAEARQVERRCGDGWALLFPGLGQMCLKKDAEAASLMVLGAAELAATVSVGERQGYDHPGAALPLLALQDLWLYDNSNVVIERALARRALYAPKDSLADLLAAPFNREVLGRADVWAGTLLCLGLGIGATWLVGNYDTSEVGTDPNVFGYELDGRVGYPLGIAVGAGLFTHVALAEETLFRGALQSGIARRSSERAGWLWASLVFGVSHSLNALVLPEDERLTYLAIGVPVITAVGTYLGYAYKRSDYSLSVPVAIHFWYNLLLSTTFFVLEPQQSPISASISVPF